jgi:tyrosyl-DNA phosphodiesterase 1
MRTWLRKLWKLGDKRVILTLDISAIAASMEAFNQQNARKNVIDDRTEDEDTDAEDEFQANLRRALEASKAEKRAETSFNGSGSKISAAKANPEPVANIPASEFLRQRALLEKERLERNRGQFNSVSAVAGTSTGSSGRGAVGVNTGQKRSYSASQSEDEEDYGDRPPKRRVSIGKTAGHYTNDIGKPNQELFYDHELRQTANQITEAQDRRNGVKTFRISDIIGEKKEVAFAILSSYSTDVAWLYSLFDPDVSFFAIRILVWLVYMIK